MPPARVHCLVTIRRFDGGRLAGVAKGGQGTRASEADQSPDFGAAGLLEGLAEEGREARLRLLGELWAEGASLDELGTAVAQDRLAVLPLERRLTTEARLTAEDLSARCGLDIEFVRAVRAGLGLARAADGAAVFREADVEAFRTLGLFRSQTEISDEALFEVVRVLGHGLWRTSEAIRTVLADALARGGDTELEVARRYRTAAEQLGPAAGPFLESAMYAHLAEGIRGEMLTQVEISSGQTDDTWEVAVCFVDLVGYTRLGEERPVDEVTAMAGRLASAAARVARPPVRLVKTIGDATMLVSLDPEALVEAAENLLAAIEADDGLPDARTGFAYGTALTRGGDWYGRTVNLASRLTAVADPGHIVSTRAGRDAVGSRGWVSAGRTTLKGFEDEVDLFRLEQP
ncbi:MAG: Adenylate cyclase [uncultured Solirubrobacterales bacterium]|uniref:Adenylate cyclase n=1 Tax=uncultured Solirubrobacterales bacterium TaxID=768556 RepID=A0A6J4SLC6_9ACTN|nr:MAG: Adenylate cyclase [uncultured Solirubrobacterales bacterium]